MADDEPDAGTTCKNFLLASPPGQFQDVLADLRSLAPAVVDAPGLVDDASRVFNTANARIASCGDDAHPVVLVAEGAVGGGHFVDVKTGDVVKVDHLAMTAAADAGAPPAPPAGADDAEALRGALAKEMDECVRVFSRFRARPSAAPAHTSLRLVSVCVAQFLLTCRALPCRASLTTHRHTPPPGTCARTSRARARRRPCSRGRAPPSSRSS